jgi:SAM-dependent methyltransferase
VFEKGLNPRRVKAVGTSGWQSTVAGMREPDLHTARAAYDAIAPVYADQFKDTLDDRPTERALLAAFAEVIRRAPAGIVADLGCGPGHIAAHLHSLGLSVFGVTRRWPKSHECLLPVAGC